MMSLAQPFLFLGCDDAKRTELRSKKEGMQRVYHESGGCVLNKGAKKTGRLA